MEEAASKYLKRDADEDRFHEWFHHHVRIALNDTVALSQWYEAYRQFLTEDLGKLPLTKKTFATLLRPQLEPYVNMDTVRIVTRRGVVIYGIALTDKDVSS